MKKLLLLGVLFPLFYSFLAYNPSKIKNTPLKPLEAPTTSMGDEKVPRKEVISGAVDQESTRWFNVLNFGAVADNSTDNTAAFQAAINACAAAGGGEVYVPASTNYYVVGNMLRIRTDNIKIRGDGMHSSKVFFAKGNSKNTGFWFTKSGTTHLLNSGLEDLQIWIQDYDLIAARFTTTLWGYVRRCNIRNISGLTDNSTAVSFMGKSIAGWSGGNIIDRCEISDVHTGVYIDSISNNNMIINSWIGGNNNRFSGSASIKIIDNGGQTDTQFISGCDFEGVEKGIFVDAVGARIIGCRFEQVDTAIHIAQVNANLISAFNEYSSVAEHFVSIGGVNHYGNIFEKGKIELTRDAGVSDPYIFLGGSSDLASGYIDFKSQHESSSKSLLEIRTYGSSRVADVFESESANRGVISSDYKLKIGTVYNKDIDFFTNGRKRARIDGGGGLVLEPSSDVDAVTGAIYFDSDNGHFWGYNGSDWVQLDN